MSCRIQIPTPLRRFTEQQAQLEIEADSVEALLEELTGRYPDLRRHLFDEEGGLRHFVNIYVNDEDVRYLEGPATSLESGDTVSIVPSIAGGRSQESPSGLSQEEIRRYSRHLIIPEVGLLGQQKLRQARVLCVGAGGLGSPSLMYLAAAGVGHLGLVDFDRVEESNLQRQIIHASDRVGVPKLESARETLERVNPHTRVQPFETRLDSDNALDLVSQFDLVIDGTDNFPTRYLVNDACVLTGKPNVYASIFQFEGQASVFAAEDGPCYRCLYPEPPPPGLVPSCAEGGVLGVLPGLLGVIQAVEAVKLILGAGQPLVGRLLLVDALQMSFRELRLRRDPDCPVCGEEPTVTSLIDYEEFCRVGQEPEDEEVPSISVQELKRRLDAGEDLFVLDVRNPPEYELCRLPDTRLIPLPELPQRLDELDPAREIVVHCKSGGRSAEAVRLLQQAGFSRLYNLEGGILEWSRSVDPSVPTY